MRIYTLRFMWKLKGKDNLAFKIVTDTEEGVNTFIDAVKKLPDVEKFGYEYLHEYDCTRIGQFVDIPLEEVGD